MRDLLTAMAARYDRIVVDNRAAARRRGQPDDRRTGRRSRDGHQVGRYPVNAVKTALAGLQQDDARLAGALFSMVESGEEAYGALYYSSKYNAYYRAE